MGAGLARLECKTGEFEGNLERVKAGIEACCCDRHAAEAALLLLRTGLVQGAEASGIKVSEEEVEALRGKCEFLFQQSHIGSDTAGIALLDLLTVVLAVGKLPPGSEGTGVHGYR